MVREFSSEQAPALVIRNAAGSVVVRSHDAPTIRVELEALTPDAAPLVDTAAVDFVASGSRPELRVVVPERAHRWRFHVPEVRVVVDIPGGGPVDVKTVSADIALEGAFGAVDIRSTSGNMRVGQAQSAHLRSISGDVTAAVVDGPCRLSTVSGDGRLGRIAKDLTFETVSGAVEVSAVGEDVVGRTVSGDVRIRDVHGTLRISTVSGDVTLECAGGSLSVSTQSGTIAVGRAGSGRIECRTTSGDIRIRLEAGRRVAVDAHTLSGALRSDFPLSEAPVGDPAAPLVHCQLHTLSGDIELSPASAEDVSKTIGAQ